MILTLSRTGNTRISLPGIFLPIALYSNIQENQTVYILRYVISKHIPVIFQSFSILVTTIVAVQWLCICAFLFKARFIFTMRNTVIALVTTFFICVIMMLPLLMISNVTAEIILFTNNVTRLIVDVDSVRWRDWMLAYMKHYLPYVLLIGLQILPMCIVLFAMVYCVCTIKRRRHHFQMSKSSQNNIHRATAIICVVMMLFIMGSPPHMGSEYTVKTPTILLYNNFDFQSMDHLWWAQSYIYHIFEIYGLMFSWVSRSDKDI